MAYFNVFKKLLFILSAFRVRLVAATDTTVVPVIDNKNDQNFHLFFPNYVLYNEICQDRQGSLFQFIPTKPRQCVISWMLIHK